MSELIRFFIYSLTILFYEAYHLIADYWECQWQPGYCLDQNGYDQNSGVIKNRDIPDKDFDIISNHVMAKCLAWCKHGLRKQWYKPAKGCEYIYGKHMRNKGCYYHPQTVSKGNGADNHYCYKFNTNLCPARLGCSNIHY